MKCKICNGLGTLKIEDDSEYDEGFCDCGNCSGTGVVPVKSDALLGEIRHLSILLDYIELLEKEVDDHNGNIGGIRHLLEIRKSGSYGVIMEIQSIVKAHFA